MSDLEAVISGALADANLSSPDPDDNSVVDVPEVDDATEVVADPVVADAVVVDPAVVAKPDAAAAAAVTPDPKVAAAEARTKELEALGLKAPKPGERENRLPHSRVVKMVTTAQDAREKKVRDEVAPQLTELTTVKTKLEAREKVDALAESDPDRFLQAMAAANPKVWGPVYEKARGVQSAAAAAAPVVKAPDSAAAVAALGPKPEPDGKYPDGSTGYTPEGLQKLQEWYTAKAVAEAVDKVSAKYEARLAPIEKERQEKQVMAERLPAVKAKIAKMRELWGPAFDADHDLADQGKSEILKYMNDTGASLEAACSAILLPRVKASGTADRDKMRTELLAEINKRPAAAAPAAAVSAGAAADDTPKTLEQIIKEQVDAKIHHR